MENLAGKSAFVTGAASGIGRGIARQLARAGVNVALADIHADAVEEAASEIEGVLTHPEARAFVDRRMARIAEAFDALEAQAGPTVPKSAVT